MKFLIVLVSCLVLNAESAINKDKAMEMALVMLNDCKTQESGSDEDVEKLMNLQFPGTTTGNCMIACIHEKMGIFSAGTFQKNVFLAMSELIVENDPVYIEVAKKVAEKCANIGGTRCDQAVEFDACMESEIKANGLDTQFL